HPPPERRRLAGAGDRLAARAGRAVKEVAEREGFEPSIRFWRILTFQASAFDHSATAPHALEAGSSRGPRSGGQGEAVDDAGQRDVAAGEAVLVVGGQRDLDPVPDVRP